MTTKNETTGSRPAAPTCSIFELVDVTNDETYYTLGLYLTSDEAITDATSGDDPPTECEDYARLEVRERTLGFTGYGNDGQRVAEIVWSEYLDEEEDEWKWHKPVVNRSNKQL